MDIVFLRQLVQPFVEFFGALILSGAASTLATQLLKADWIPVPATKYPRTVAAVASVIATAVSIYASNLHLLLVGWWQYLAFAVGAFIVSAVTYNHVVKGSGIVGDKYQR
jgi:hypothetical protein